MDFYKFYRGQEFEAYQYLGAHEKDGGTVFRTFAPSARSISVTGSFNNWGETPMSKVHDGNFWECFIPEAKEGMLYKYKIQSWNGNVTDHADPYAFYAEKRPASASIIHSLDDYTFKDQGWQKRKRNHTQEPVNIYELQAGSWRLPDPSDPEKNYSWRELASLLVPYLQSQGYNYLELMPVTEYPCDESWGYQATGFFSPTSRYGRPDGLKFLIDQCHRYGIGVILDFVAVHFASNDYGLKLYDGTSLYEYPSNDVGYSEWGSCNFMHSRGETRSLLISSANYWMKEFHFDGIRVDAVSNLVYWQGDQKRGVNQQAVEFLRTLNQGLKERYPKSLLIAEDSSTYPGVTRPVNEGGLGFDYKWDLGWMNDTLSYMKALPFARKDLYHKLTFSIYYYYNERYLLPLSHDEVVHGKASLWQKMNGDKRSDKFSQLRLLSAYMYAHPGKKLSFMGNELAGPYEWSEKKELDWWVLRDFSDNRDYQSYMKALSKLYLSHPALWEKDYERDGFEWLDCSNEGKNAVYAFVRRSRAERILCLFNFDGASIAYSLPLPGESKAETILDSTAQGTKAEIRDGSLSVTLPAFSALFLQL